MKGAIATLAAVGLALASGRAAVGQSGALAVIVHQGTPVDALSLNQLRRLFLGDQQFWGDQTRVALLMPPTGAPARAAALRAVYQMSEAAYRQYWVAKIFRAEVTSGPRVATPEQARRVVAATRGAVAIVPAGAVDGSVKVLRIGGRLPEESGYPLR
jgi:ABC-type phosphate transport system substrate-binding protein